MLTSRLCLLACLICFMACQGDSVPSRDEKLPPNFVIIFTDDQGYQDVGCYGSPDIETPHLDQMAQEGARFPQFYVSQGVCSASRASLLTGCYANRVGVHGAYFPKAKSGLAPEEMTLAEMLKPLGYRTGIFGKWHLGDHPDLLPTAQGFDEYLGIPYSNDMWPSHPANDQFNFDFLPLIEGQKVIDSITTDQSHLTTLFTERAVNFIRKNKAAPFFLYVPHCMPHVPLFVSEKNADSSARGLYGDVIQEIDWSVGQILQTLKAEGLDEHTMVIFASDNGPWLNYGNHSGSALPLREGKGTSLEGGVRVPCIMRWPGKIQAGTEIPAPAMTIDILPTLAGLAGAALPDRKVDGGDIWPLLSGQTTESPHESFAFYYHRNHLQGVLSGDGRWKLYFPHKYRSLEGREGGRDGLPVPYNYQTPMGLELYDLNTDISETQNVADRYPEILARLEAEGERYREALGDELTDRVGKENRPAAQVSWE
ncbi:MAG: sulfatase [Bacteroidota bacterium]